MTGNDGVFRTKTGRVLTDADIEMIAAEDCPECYRRERCYWVFRFETALYRHWFNRMEADGPPT